MGQTQYPPVSGSYSSIPPVNASSVLLDGELIANSYSTTVNFPGGAVFLYANGAGTATITINGNGYTVAPGATVVTSSYTGSQSVSITTTAYPTSFGIYAGPTTLH